MATATLDQVSEREQWLAERKKGLGGSDVKDYLQIPPYGCTRKLVYDKRGEEMDYQPVVTAPMERGIWLEDKVAELYMEKTGRSVRRMPTAVSKDREWARVNIDRHIVAFDDRGPGVLEIKTADRFVYDRIERDGLPEEYIAQLQHGMFVKGWKWGSFAVCNPDTMRLIWFDMDRNQALIDVLTQRGEYTWGIIANPGIEVPPRPAEKPIKACAGCPWRKRCWGSDIQVPREVADNKYDVDESLGNLAQELVTVREQLDRFAQLEEEIVTDLKAQIGERTGVEVPSAGIKILYKPQKGAMRWDTKALENEHPELAAKYKRTSAPTRPFKVYTL